LLSPDEVAFYNRLDRTFYQGPVSVIESIIPAQLNYEHIERLILGQPLFVEAIKDLKESKRKTVNLLTNELITNRVFSGELDKPAEGLYRVGLSSDNSQIIFQEFEIKELDRVKITYQYKDKDRYTPHRIRLVAGSRALNLGFEGVQLDKKLSLPFQIPSGFTMIK